jgi:virginiamycin A acetyltransferase
MDKEFNKQTKSPLSYLTNLFYHLYSIKPLRKIIIKVISKLEGGEFYSVTLRRIASSYHNVQVGMYSYGSCFIFRNIAPGTEIGRYCSFADGVTIFNGNHPLENKSMHPFFYNPRCKYVTKDMIARTRLIIGNDVWIGHNAIILPSVKAIGDGAVIGAGSVVTKDVLPFAVVTGNPAKIIKYRFSEDKMREIMKSAWWDKNIEEIKQKEFVDFLSPL